MDPYSNELRDKPQNVPYDSAYGPRPKDKWWLAPACRSNASSCIALVTGPQAWGFNTMLQQAAFHNMPIAFASAKSAELYEQINRDLKSLTFWWTPDTTFSDPQPSLVIMPPHDAAEWRQGIYKTGLRAQPLQKWASFAFSRVASRANSLVQNVDIVESDMQELISMYLSGSHSRYEAACEWIRLHSNRWEAWVPAKTECNVGEGLVASNGDFVSSKVSADECGTCPPGRASEKLANTFRCSSCQVLGLGPLGFRV